MYHEKFPAHEVQARAPRPPREAYKSGGAFDGTTTSGSTYTAHPIPPRSVRPADRDAAGCTSITGIGTAPRLQVLLVGRYLAHICAVCEISSSLLL